MRVPGLQPSCQISVVLKPQRDLQKGVAQGRRQKRPHHGSLFVDTHGVSERIAFGIIARRRFQLVLESESIMARSAARAYPGKPDGSAGTNRRADWSPH